MLDERARRRGELDVAAPSRLPDWTVGHVLTHLARNADSIVRVLAGQRARRDRRPLRRRRGRPRRRDRGRRRPAGRRAGRRRPAYDLAARAARGPGHVRWDGQSLETSGRRIAVADLVFLRLAGGRGPPRRPRARLRAGRLAGGVRARSSCVAWRCAGAPAGRWASPACRRGAGPAPTTSGWRGCSAVRTSTAWSLPASCERRGSRRASNRSRRHSSSWYVGSWATLIASITAPALIGKPRLSRSVASTVWRTSSGSCR